MLWHNLSNMGKIQMRNKSGFTESKNRPENYCGSLSPEKVASGINAVLKNARLLVEDAQLLFDNGRYSTAASLAALAIEESGKVSILRALCLERDEVCLKGEWKRFRDHRSKNGMWILPALVAQGVRKLNKLAQTVDRNAEHTELLNSIKQIGFYVDCYGDAHWSEPSKIIDKDLAEMLLKTASIFANDHYCSIKEVELWIEYMRPAWKTTDMPTALINWIDAMRQEGLSYITPDEMANFIGIKLDNSSK